MPQFSLKGLLWFVLVAAVLLAPLAYLSTGWRILALLLAVGLALELICWAGITLLFPPPPPPNQSLEKPPDY
jgi:hypothetical protein